MSCRVSTRPGELGSTRGPTRPPGKRAGRSSLRGARSGDGTGRGKGPTAGAQPEGPAPPLRGGPAFTAPSLPPSRRADCARAPAAERGSRDAPRPRPFPAGRSLGASRALGGRGECPRGAPASRTRRAWAGTPPAERLAGPRDAAAAGYASRPSPQPGVRVARPGARRGRGAGGRGGPGGAEGPGARRAGGRTGGRRARSRGGLPRPLADR